MKSHYYGGYVEYKQKIRRSPLRSRKEHRGTVQEFIALAEAQAHALGSIRPVEYWGMQPYAKEMFDCIADQRMLYRA